MNWAAITGIGTLVSTIVVVVAVILAMHQLRELRRATELEGTMNIFSLFHDPSFMRARQFVFSELPLRLKNPDYRHDIEHYASLDFANHPEFVVLSFLNEIGALVRQRLLDGPSVYQYAQYSILKSYEKLSEVVALQRRGMDNPYAWANAEYLYDNAKEWMRRDLSMHPKVRPSTGEPFTPEFLR